MFYKIFDWLLGKFECKVGLHVPGRPFGFFFLSCVRCGEVLINMDAVKYIDNKVGRPNATTEWIHESGGF